MTHTFKSGDVVALKSGGHAMTVHSYSPAAPATMHCGWFDESGALRDGLFIAACVTPVIRKAVNLDEVTIRHIWVFAETGEPIADHIAYRA